MRLKLSFVPRDWQVTAFEAWRKAGERGIVEVVTGGGKTVFAGLCSSSFFERHPDGYVFVVVPTIELAKQWQRTFQDDFGAEPSRILIFGGGKKPRYFDQVNIMVANTARRIIPMLPIDRRGQSLLIADECHRMASDENSKAISGSWAATLGLSATPEREFDDLFDEVLVPALGPVIYEYSYLEAGQDGVIVPFHLTNIQVGLLPHEQDAFDEVDKEIRNLIARRSRGERVQTVLERCLRLRATISKNASLRAPIAARALDNHFGERSVVFHESIDEAERIAALLDLRGHRVGTYHSRLSPDTRAVNFENFRKGRIDVLVTCRALDEGVNIPEARVAIIASSTSSVRQRIQRLGRVLRPHPSKDASIVKTLYCTPQEEARLRLEEQDGAAYSTTWLMAGV